MVFFIGGIFDPLDLKPVLKAVLWAFDRLIIPGLGQVFPGRGYNNPPVSQPHTCSNHIYYSVYNLLL